jgi:hypothetical protein
MFDTLEHVILLIALHQQPITIPLALPTHRLPPLFVPIFVLNRLLLELLKPILAFQLAIYSRFSLYLTAQGPKL